MFVIRDERMAHAQSRSEEPRPSPQIDRNYESYSYEKNVKACSDGDTCDAQLSWIHRTVRKVDDYAARWLSPSASDSALESPQTHTLLAENILVDQ